MKGENVPQTNGTNRANGTNGVAAHTLRENGHQHSMPIAIVGMSCRFPGGADTPEKLWNMISAGKSSWTTVPEDRFNAKSFYHPNTEIHGTFNCKGAHFIDNNVRAFDAQFFGINPNEAKTLDPQQRLQLECAYEALENAGISMESVEGSNTAVYVSVFNKDYDRMLFRDPDDIPAYHMVGNGEAILSNRISHFFDLRGPSITLDTGCSGGLVAIHQACQSIRTGESDQAIVGGTNLMLAPEIMTSLSAIRFFSNEGRCFSYDERAAGYGRGEGVAAVILKPLAAAMRNGDPIRAVIRGTAINQDGRTQGITVPSRDAQIALIRSAYSSAGLDPSRTAFCEAHGTGTAVGDPIEAGAIGSVFGKARTADQPIYVGSVKTNIGHLESASGLAGLIKTVLMLEKGKIAPNYDFQTLNKKINSSDWNLEVPKTLLSWPQTGTRQASVNSFGYGGTNCHAVLDNSHEHHVNGNLANSTARNGASINETHSSGTNSNGIHSNGATNGISANGTSSIKCSHEHNRDEQVEGSVHLRDGAAPKLFVISARTQQRCVSQLEAFKEYLKNQDGNSESYLEDLAHTLSFRRSIFPWRWATSAATLEELKTSLESNSSKVQRSKESPKIGFVFTGQGAQWYGMGRELLCNSVFKASLERADRHLKSIGADWSLFDELSKDGAASRVTQANPGQPLVIAIQLAVVDLLASWKITPSFVIGHSSGEIAAAYTSGIVSFESAISIAYWRGYWSSQIKTKNSKLDGAMMAVALSETEVQIHLTKLQSKGRNISVACSNSPSSVTISGDRSAVLELQEILQPLGIFARLLKVDTAYHSQHMNEISKDYLAAIAEDLASQDCSNNIRFFSSVTATKAFPQDLCPSYWVRNMVSKVRFSEALQAMCTSSSGVPGEAAVDILLEVGPHSALAGPIKQILQTEDLKATAIQYLPTLIRDQDAEKSLFSTASHLWSIGASVDLESIQGFLSLSAAKPRVLHDLPVYQWDHSVEHWREPRMSVEHRNRPHARHELLGHRSVDFDPAAPRWRGVMRLSEVPWLKDHRMQSSVIYPAAGYIAMAIEAVRQHVADHWGRDVVPEKFCFAGVNITRALVLDDDVSASDSTGVEVATILHLQDGLSLPQHPSDIRYDFRIRSFDQAQGWVDHCHGVVSAKFIQLALLDGEQLQEAEIASLQQRLNIAKSSCTLEKSKLKLYAEFSEQNIQYEGNFATVERCFLGNKQSLGFVQVSEAATDPSSSAQQYPVHPTSLDGCFQVLLAMIMNYTGMQGALLLNSIKELEINSALIKEPSQQLLVHSKCPAVGPLGGLGSLVAVAKNGNLEHITLVKASGINIMALPAGRKTDEANKVSCFRMNSFLDIELASPSKIFKICHEGLEETKSPPEEILQDLTLASLYFIQVAFHQLGSGFSTPKEQPHLQHLLNWMKVFVVENSNGPHSDLASWKEQDVQTLLQRVRDSGTEGEMLCRMGHHLPTVLDGSAPPLPLMLKDNLLRTFYYNESLSRCYFQMGQYLHRLAMKKPRMKILEIGAGTGGTTLSVLRALSKSESEDVFMFKSYDFTDISSGFFEKAQKLLRRWKDGISFKRLDIEQTPSTQGFEKGTYDLVIASNVLHATIDINRTIRNARELLKPGGKIVLLEITRLQAHLNVSFGGLPGWWAGVPDGRVSSPLMTQSQWRTTLTRNHFSDFDVCLADYDGGAKRTEVLVSTATDMNQISSSAHLSIIVNPTDQKTISIASEITETLQSTVDVVTRDISSLSATNLHGKLCIFLADISGSVLSSFSSNQIKALLDTISTATGVLWITQYGNEMSLPHQALLTALLRSWRIQRPHLKLITLDLDSKSDSHAQINTTCGILRSCFQSFNHTNEWEYIERNGDILISRLLSDDPADKFIGAVFGPQDPVSAPFYQSDRPLKLELSSSSIGDLIFEDDLNAQIPILENELQLEPLSIGLTMEDAKIASGKSNNPIKSLREYTGIVRAVGSNCKGRFKVGDRVCAVGFDWLSSHPRVNVDFTHLLPENVPFRQGSMLPLSLGTAYYCLMILANAQKGESILIQSAATSLGQAIVSVANLLGLRVFAMVDDVQGQEILAKNFAVDPAHIFQNGRVDLKTRIKAIEGDAGIDIVILGSEQKTSLRDSCECVGAFGRIISLKKDEQSSGMGIGMELLKRNVTFASVDMELLFNYKPQVFKLQLDKVISLIHDGLLKLPPPGDFKPISEAREACQELLSRTGLSNTILDTKIDQEVKVRPERLKTCQIHENATYLIVGNSLGVESKLCQWLSEKKAKSILLLLHNDGAKPDSTALKSMIEEYQGRGINLSVSFCDLNQMDELSRTLQRFQQKMHAIRGVFNVDFVSEVNESESLDPLSRASNAGLKHLEDLVEHKLDFFVLISSTSGIVGESIRVDLAASSAYRTAITKSTARADCSIVSLDLGVLTSSELSASFPHCPLTIEDYNISSTVFCSLMDYATKQSHEKDARDIIVDLNPAPASHGRWPFSDDPRLAHTQLEKAVDEQTSQSIQVSLETELRNCSDLSSMAEVMYQALISKLSKLLACPIEEFKPTASISQFGVDSLVAAELRAWISQSLGASTEIVEILGRDSMIDFATNIARRSKLANDSSQEKTAEPLLVKTESARKTLEFQDSLPKMPVPSLDLTLEKYAKSIRCLQDDAEYEKSLKSIQEFNAEGGVGSILQERLIARSNDPNIKNWLYDYWVEHYYLRPRKPIAPATNFFLSHKDGPINYPIPKRAAILSRAVLDFKNAWDNGTLEPAMLHDEPICMESYHWMFNACRIPMRKEDQSIKHETSNHIVVVFRNHFYRIEGDQNGQTLNVAELEWSFERLIRETSEHGPRIGVLTTENRDSWADTRQAIMRLHQDNKISLQAIESAAFIICLDDTLPQTSEERAHQFWHGNGSNRFSDKPIQFIVTPGNSGFNGEHSRLDGSPTIRLNKHVNKVLLEYVDPASIEMRNLEKPKQLQFHLSTEILERIDAAQDRFDKAVIGCELEFLAYDGFGERFLRQMGCNPSACVQMVFQLATYRFYGKSIPSFEPVGNFRFRQGRYDAARTLSEDTQAFCKSMVSNDDPTEQLKSLRHAMAGHIKQIREISYGGSVDNHMFGLWMSLREDEEVPAMFLDPIFRYSTDWFFSTSYMPADEMEYGFGPDLDNGWSIQYPIFQDKIVFCITTRTFRAKEMRAHIRQAADDIKALLLLQTRQT